MDTFLYVNLNSYPVVVNGPFGGPITVPRNKAVRGDYFARFAQPKGPLQMVSEKLVAPTAVVFEARPLNEAVAKAWEDSKVKSDPMLFHAVPPSMSAHTITPPSIESPIQVGDVVDVDGKEEVVMEVKDDTLIVDDPLTTEVEATEVSKKKARKGKAAKKV